MKKHIFSTVLVLIFAAGTFAQRAAPTPTPQTEDDVVKITTSLIQIDVSATDKNGKAVTDLKPDEVEIYENGQKQKISGFTFVSAGNTATVPAKPAAVDKTGVPLPPTELRPDKVRRTFALVVDDLSLSFESSYQTRRALKKFVDEQMQDGDLVAIIRTGAGIGALQGFTSDKRVLYAAIERVRWNALGTGGISAFAPIESTPDTSLQADPSATPDPTATPANPGQSLDDFRSAVFATGTLGALRYVVTGMSELPGRKSVILFSDGFKLTEKDDSGFENSGMEFDFVRQLVDLANRSSVVFYAIDPRGLQTLSFTAADAISNSSPDAMNAARKTRRDQLIETQAGLSYLADETGGFAVLNSNDVPAGVQRVVEDQSYYLVAYEPDADTFDPAKRRFNKLQVKVLRKGVAVRYRSGFFNVETAAHKPVEAATQTVMMRLQSALTSPFAVGGISLRLNALFGNDAINGTFVRSLLHIEAKDLKYTDGKDGEKTAVFDVLAASFGDNGQVVDQIAKSYTLKVSAAGYKQLMDDGFIYSFMFPVKKPGAYQYRVAIRDVRSEKIGSASQFIEVPDLKRNRLTASSIILEDISPEAWDKMNVPNSGTIRTNPMGDTALRRVRMGSILRYGFQIYNGRLDASQKPALNVRIRVFREGKLVLDGKPTPLDNSVQTDMKRIRYSGALGIGGKMLPGDYVLQAIITDTLAKTRDAIATQFVQFEVVP